METPTDYPETPEEQMRNEREMVAAAESDAPPAMLAAQREWDARVSR